MSLKPSKTTVFILAAGRGLRMMPLTANTPKPLLKIGEFSLIEHHINRLVNKGFNDFVINVDYLGDNIKREIGDGSRWGIRITYSDEQAYGALETAGGIQHALPLIKSDYFLAVNADIWTDFDFNKLLVGVSQAPQVSDFSAAIVLVENPKHNPDGDFCIDNNKQNLLDAVQHKNTINPTLASYTFSGIGLYSKAAFTTVAPGKSALAPLLRQWLDSNALFGMVFNGQWSDIGTPERLAEINYQLD